MPSDSAKNRPIRRKIDFDRIGNKILILLYQRYMESKGLFVLFNEIAAAIPSEPRNAVWDEVQNLIARGDVVQKTETRVDSGFGALAALSRGGKQQTYEVAADGYKITRRGIDATNNLTDEAYEVLIAEVAVVEQAPEHKGDSWEPLPLDRQSTEFAKAVEATDAALKEIETSNGYADSNPIERDSIVEVVRAHLGLLRTGLLSKGQIIEGLIRPLKYIGAKFAEASIGELANRAAKFLWMLIGGN
ncbi:MAG: hypothetical protein QOF19_1383 [Alphaproteobacteria bacterium]|jgi:hypothetical protein|nr:hypothetical protein [Alphaproteobacteria bacterium]